MDPTTQTLSPPTDHNDATFEPRSPSGLRTMTRSSTTALSCAPDKVKTALTQLAPDGQRCLITREEAPLQCSHLIARCSSAEMQTRIEDAWGMKLGEFHLHILSNLLWLCNNMHALFDAYGWVLLPTEEDLKAVVAFDTLRAGKRASSSYIETLPNKIWNYHFVQFRPTPSAFLRVNATGSHDMHQHPFETLGLIQSHVHPFYVVYNVGEKVHHIWNPKRDLHRNCQLPPQHRPSLGTCEMLYRSWTNPPLETPESHAQQSPSDRPHPPTSTSRSQSNRKSQQCQERADWAQRRSNGARNSPQPGSGAGAPEGHNCIAAISSTADQYLPTPEQSLHSTDCHPTDPKPQLENHSVTSFPTLHWASIDDWVADVRSSAPGEDPHLGGTEQAKQSLVQYSFEVARVPPWGSWEKWIAEYDLV